MNDEQIEMCLTNLKSSSREPGKIDGVLEERMMDLHMSIGRRKLRARRFVAGLAVFFLLGTGFVALGGDAVVINYVSPATERDAEGNLVPNDFSIGKWLRNMHDHVWEHFKNHHNIKD